MRAPMRPPLQPGKCGDNGKEQRRDAVAGKVSGAVRKIIGRTRCDAIKGSECVLSELGRRRRSAGCSSNPPGKSSANPPAELARTGAR
jgi:hypothetical protein